MKVKGHEKGVQALGKAFCYPRLLLTERHVVHYKISVQTLVSLCTQMVISSGLFPATVNQRVLRNPVSNSSLFTPFSKHSGRATNKLSSFQKLQLTDGLS